MFVNYYCFKVPEDPYSLFNVNYINSNNKTYSDIIKYLEISNLMNLKDLL